MTIRAVLRIEFLRAHNETTSLHCCVLFTNSLNDLKTILPKRLVGNWL